MKRRIVLLAAALAFMATQQDTVSSEAGLTPAQTVSGRVSDIFSDGFELEYFDPAVGRQASIPFVWDGQINKDGLCRVEYRQEGYGFFAQKVTPYALPDIRYAVVAGIRPAAPGRARVLVVIDEDEYTQILDLPSAARRTISQGAVLYLDPKNRIVRVEMPYF